MDPLLGTGLFILAAVVYFFVVVPYTKAKERYFPSEEPGTPADVACPPSPLDVPEPSPAKVVMVWADAAAGSSAAVQATDSNNMRAFIEVPKARTMRARGLAMRGNGGGPDTPCGCRKRQGRLAPDLRGTPVRVVHTSGGSSGASSSSAQ